MIDGTFGPGVVARFRVLGRGEGVRALGDELVALGLQVQRLTRVATGKS